MESECLRVQITKYETLARVRADRVHELEQQVLALSGAHGDMERELVEVSGQLEKALATIEDVVAENQLLKQENEQVARLRVQLQQERELSVMYQSKSQPRTSSMFANMYARTNDEVKVKRPRVGVQTDEPLSFSRSTQIDDFYKFRE
jgi:predicted RNase H-like nuclease (RuvC/YqgF family)